MTHSLNTVLDRIRTKALGQEDATMTDGQLLERYLTNRSEAAFAALVRRHGQMVFAVCRRVTFNAQDAEDAFQATFLVLVRKAGSVRPREMVGNWLYGVAYRAALKARTIANRHHAREIQMKNLPEPATIEMGLWEDMLPLLDQELSALPEKYRVPIVLCDLEGKSRKEAATSLGWPEGTVASRIAQARSLLAKRLARHGLPVTGGILTAILAQSAASAGGVPTSLASSTVKAANLLATGHATTVGLISAKVAALTDGVLKAMLICKLKSAALVLVALAMMTIGGAMLVMGQPANDDWTGGRLAIAGARKEAKETKDQGPAKDDQIVWGETVNGIQAGISLKGGITTIRVGDTATFAIVVRNVSDAPVTISYLTPVYPVPPKVKDAAGKSIKVWEPTITETGESQRRLAPKQVFEIGSARLTLYANAKDVPFDDAGSGAVLTPGKYKIHFIQTARPREELGGPMVPTGIIEIEVDNRPLIESPPLKDWKVLAEVSSSDDTQFSTWIPIGFPEVDKKTRLGRVLRTSDELDNALARQSERDKDKKYLLKLFGREKLDWEREMLIAISGGKTPPGYRYRVKIESIQSKEKVLVVTYDVVKTENSILRSDGGVVVVIVPRFDGDVLFINVSKK